MWVLDLVWLLFWLFVCSFVISGFDCEFLFVILLSIGSYFAW